MQRDDSGQEGLEFYGLEALDYLDSPSLQAGWSGPFVQQPRAEDMPEADPGFELQAQNRPTRTGLRPSSGDLVTTRSLEGSGSGGSQKAKERNKKAQRTFRNRQKVSHCCWYGRIESQTT